MLPVLLWGHDLQILEPIIPFLAVLVIHLPAGRNHFDESRDHKPMHDEILGMTVPVEVYEQVAPSSPNLSQQLVPNETAYFAVSRNRVVRIPCDRSPVVVGHVFLPRGEYTGLTALL